MTVADLQAQFRPQGEAIVEYVIDEKGSYAIKSITLV